MFRSIPAPLREAAKVDGAKEWQIFIRIFIPLAKPGLITISVLGFVAFWNEYVFTSVSITNPSRFTLPIALANLLGQNVVPENSVMAAALIMVVPIIVVFVILQRYFVAALAGGIKG